MKIQLLIMRLHLLNVTAGHLCLLTAKIFRVYDFRGNIDFIQAYLKKKIKHKMVR